MNVDSVAFLEAAYDLAPSHREWLSSLLALLGPDLARGFGMAAWTLDLDAADAPQDIVLWGMPSLVAAAMTATFRADRSAFSRRHGESLALCTATQSLGLTVDEALRYPFYAEHLHPVGIRDVLALHVDTPLDRAVIFAAPIPDVRRPTRADVAKWRRIGVHLAAGARLRHVLAGPSSPRDRLRAAARTVDRVRGSGREGDEETLGLWRALVAGRWSLVDRFDSDGRRYLVARRNEPDVLDPRSLSLRERQVLALAAFGQPLKVIAHSLGLSLATVAEHRAQGMRKLGLRSTTELVRLFTAVSAIESHDSSELDSAS